MPPAPANRFAQSSLVLDELLEDVGGALQITSTQYERAKSAYRGVATWLSSRESALAPFDLQIYPQGSAALGTTTRPVCRNDYDVDVVCQFGPTGWDAIANFEAVYQRLAAHGTYAPMLERKSRCIRLAYASDFHLDLVPAEPAPLSGLPRGELAIRITDRPTRLWTPSNPAGYVRWFHETAETARILKEARAAKPLPPRKTVANNTVLALVVQLIKRRRDVRFASAERATLAPPSVVLTTRAAGVYDGEQSAALALRAVVRGMATAVRAEWPSRVVVPNPTNPRERFCDRFTDEGYDAFVEFLVELERDVEAVFAISGGLPELEPVLARLFGADPVRKALLEYGERVGTAARNRKLLASPTSGITIARAAETIAASSGIVVPSHRFFGEA